MKQKKKKKRKKNISSIDDILTSTTTLGQSGPQSNGNERVLYTPQISATEASPSDAVQCYT